MRRLGALALGSCVLLSASGCYTSRQVAEDDTRVLRLGMSMAEVREQLGDPDLVVAGDPGTETAWTYRFTGGPTPICIVLAVMFVAVLIIALVAAGGGGGGWGGVGGGGGDDPPVQVRMVFDGKGRLVEVSPPHPVP